MGPILKSWSAYRNLVALNWAIVVSNHRKTINPTMDILERHKEYEERRKFRSFFWHLFVYGIIFAMMAYAIKTVFQNSEFLNKNSGAIASFLTVILVTITAYYAWWTQALVKNEQRRFEAQFRPVVILKNPHLTTNKRNTATDNEESGSSRDDRADQQCTFHMELFVFNAPAIGLYVNYHYPLHWDSKKNDYEYCRSALSPIPFVEHDKSQKLKIAFHQFPSSEELVKHWAYIIVDLWYNDKILSRHHDQIYIRISCDKIKYGGDLSYFTSINVCHESSSSEPARVNDKSSPAHFPLGRTRLR